jgi:hypothetical protein
MICSLHLRFSYVKLLLILNKNDKKINLLQLLIYLIELIIQISNNL